MNKETQVGPIVLSDLKLRLQRKKIDPFLLSIFNEIEGESMKKIIGGCFSVQAALVDGDDTLFLCSVADEKKLKGDIGIFLKNASMDSLKLIFQKSQAVAETTPQIITSAEQMSDREVEDQYMKLLQAVSENLLYITSIPFFFLEVIEMEGEAIPEREYIQAQAEKFRAFSFYPDLKGKILDRIPAVLAAKFGISTEQFHLLSIEEVRAIDDGLMQVPEDLSQRTTCLLWKLTGEPNTIFSLNETLIKTVKDTVLQTITHTEELSGTVAFQGKVRGTVKIVHTAADVDKVETGDILVSLTTNPTLMPAIIKCGALISDEGGMGCHAAIVARELKKPCIVGTKIATQIFKDGDEVEVDAYVGTVHKVSQE